MISAAIIILFQSIVSLGADKLITVISDGEPDQFIRSHPIDRMRRLYATENHHNIGHGNITHDMTAYSPAISAILSIILPSIAVATIGGNFLVILAVTLVKKLQTPSNILIVSLAFSDFFVGLLVLPFAILDLLKGYWPFNEPLCDMYISFDVLLCTASILNLCAISIDRYLVITRPLTYVSKRTPCRMAQMIAATWIISALICIPPNIGWKSPFQEGRCEYSEDVGYQIYATFCAFYLPLLVMLVLYGKIFKLAREMSRNEQRQMMPCTQNNLQHQTSQTADDPNNLNSQTCLPRQVESPSEKCDNDAFVNSVPSGPIPGPVDTTGPHPLTNGKSEEDRIRRQTANTVTFSEDESRTRTSFWKPPSNPDLVRRRSKNSSETKVIKTLGIIMGCFCLCWLPFFMVQLLLALLKAGKVKTDGLVPKACFQFLQWLGYINSSLNPLIYAKFNQEFRLPFKLILLCHCRNINARLRSAAFSAQYGLSSSGSRRSNSVLLSVSTRADRSSRIDSGRRRPPSQPHIVHSGASTFGN
ncbi:5-hydroxytryptamine receptor 7 [Clonorchis sinensis]|uniref:5-hydroxytryptamine receptor 7 n=1 Tax=Clonorchis sinensis TaxID=79923 RepID=H2KTM2_CLOSI|nr:5-hydroxytryptamine receptor 7 [Clonorchis sinensis]